MKWINNLNVSKKLFLLILVFLIMLIAVGGTGYYYLLKSSRDMNQMYHETLLPIEWMNENRNQTRKIEAEIYDLILTTDEKNKQHIVSDIASREKDAIYRNLDLYKATTLDDSQIKLLDELNKNLENYRIVREQVIQLALDNKKSQAYDLYIKKGRSPFDKVSKNLADLADHDQKEADRINQENQANFVKAKLLFIVIIVFALALTTWLGWLISRRISFKLKEAVSFLQEAAQGKFVHSVAKDSLLDKSEFGMLLQSVDTMNKNIRGLITELVKIVEHLSNSSEQLSLSAEQSAQASNQVAISVTEVAKGADNQSAIAASTLSVVEKMTAGIQQVSTNSLEVYNSTHKTEQAANLGEKAVSQAVDQMKVIEEKTGETVAVISELEEKSKQIGEIIDVMASIASQTNLLALNAAIEAARAGEAGRGFSVVADEVRKLAEQSGAAAQQITDLIGQVQQKTVAAVRFMAEGKKEVHVGTQVVNKAGDNFKQIIEMIKDISVQTQATTVALEQVITGSQHVETAVQKIDSESKNAASQTQNISASTEEQSASIEEIASSSQQLAKMAENLQVVISKFKV